MLAASEALRVVEKRAEKKKAVSKKRPAPTVGTPAVKRKRTTGKSTPAGTSLELVPVAQEAVPIQMISAVTPPSSKRKTPKRRLTLPAGSDDEIFDKEPAVESFVEQRREKTTADEVDKIIDNIISKTAQMETDMDEPSKMASFTEPKQFHKEHLRSGEDDDMSGSKQPSKIIEPTVVGQDKEIEPVATDDLSLAKNVATMTDSEDTEPLIKVLELTDGSKSDEESMSIEDILKQIQEGMMLPSFTAAEPTRIKFGRGIEIPEVSEGDWYKASLPRIATTEKGKVPLVEDEIKGHPAREMFSLICADIDFLSSFKISSRLFEGVHRDRGAMIARSNTTNRSLSWIRTKILVDGSWLIQEANDFWSSGCVLGKWVYLVTLAMSVFDLQDVCIAIGSLATLDLPMVVDLIGIYVLKGPYCTLTTTNWFLQELSVIPRGSWGDVARRFTMIRLASPKL
ncbi:splicing factor 3B subunit 1-like [Dorcoceras hygrometricum]|uniref:Splicing factor 3B subunit 1-like n=1 Tax=Dorcoceras hygrometricum TaxID=472368 RepID=A0A2Z7DEN0_9LAMI|nr:splicing factor 3B subunit 1-like [Dorcoceras hygrometricum]